MMLLLPLLLVLPLAVMLWTSLLPFVQPPSMQALSTVSLENYASAFSNSAVVDSILNTLVVSSVSATVIVAITILGAWLILRTKVPGRWAIDFLATLPLVFPGIVLGLGVLRTYLTVPIPIYGTIWIIAVAFIAKFLPYGMRYNSAGLLAIHRELEEGAQMSGASFWRIVRSILVPLLMPAIIATWTYVFLVTSHELSEALLLTTQGNEILSITIWDLWQNGQIGDLTAFSVVVTTGLVIIAYVLFRFSRRRGAL
jgi:iron(III) transport system permease protein